MENLSVSDRINEMVRDFYEKMKAYWLNKRR